jgi:Meiotically up-regulated gene 113
MTYWTQRIAVISFGFMKNKKTENKPGFIYVALDENKGHYKIGKTTRKVDIRLKEHRTANHSLNIALQLPVSNASGSEARLRNHFEALRISGTSEWFIFNESHIVEIERLLGEYERDWPLHADVERFKKAISSPDFISPTADDEKLVSEFRQAEQDEARAAHRRAMLGLKLMVRIARNAGIKGLVSWESSLQMRLDQAALKQDEPAIWERFRRESRVRTLHLL